MDLLVDTREKDRAIKKIVAEFESQGINYDSQSLYVGDYMNLSKPRIVVDRKQNLSELYTNMCHEGKQGRNYESCQRFIKELERSNRMKIGIYFLIEHGEKIKSLDDVKEWYNPRLEKNPYAWDGKCMYKHMMMLLKKYPYIRFRFCDKKNTGKEIIKLLSQERK